MTQASFDLLIVAFAGPSVAALVLAGIWLASKSNDLRFARVVRRHVDPRARHLQVVRIDRK